MEFFIFYFFFCNNGSQIVYFKETRVTDFNNNMYDRYLGQQNWYECSLWVMTVFDQKRNLLFSFDSLIDQI